MAHHFQTFRTTIIISPCLLLMYSQRMYAHDIQWLPAGPVVRWETPEIPFNPMWIPHTNLIPSPFKYISTHNNYFKTITPCIFHQTSHFHQLNHLQSLLIGYYHVIIVIIYSIFISNTMLTKSLPIWFFRSISLSNYYSEYLSIIRSPSW